MNTRVFMKRASLFGSLVINGSDSRNTLGKFLKDSAKKPNLTQGTEAPYRST